jgi:sulfite exporter TauE/SafE
MAFELGSALLASTLFGLASSTHCIGMCGTALAAMSFSGVRDARRIAVLPLPTLQGRSSSLVATPIAISMPQSTLSPALSWHAGRLASYAFAGAIAGGLGSTLANTWVGNGTMPLRAALFVFANLLVIAAAVSLISPQHAGGVRLVEHLARPLWRYMQPVLHGAQRLARSGHNAHHFILGAVWGWIPCGFVYMSLATAMSTAASIPANAASPLAASATGAATMFAFGVGTIPALLGVTLLSHRLKGAAQTPMVRRVFGWLLLLVACANLASLSSRTELSALLALCASALGKP